MLKNQFLLAAWLFSLVQILHSKQHTPHADIHLQDFITQIEHLVINTTDRALIVTKNVYLNVSQQMCTESHQETLKMLESYIAAVDDALQTHKNYTAKRQLFKRFRSINQAIDGLHSQAQATEVDTQLQLISEDFYKDRTNRTEFDNLYLEFMQKFQQASQQLWDNMSEQTVEENQDLLEVLDEISNETQLEEKDKLYDEFIEMFLFKDLENNYGYN